MCACQIRRKLYGLRGLTDRLKQMSQYLQNVLDGKIAHSHEILFNMQKMVNLLPNLAVDSLVKSMFVETNDSHLVRVRCGRSAGFAQLFRIVVRVLGADPVYVEGGVGWGGGLGRRLLSACFSFLECGL